MTRTASRPPDLGPGHDTLEEDILAALWEEVPFPRLPPDAPQDIKDLVVDVENPRRVYNVHRASRRHHLQLLIERFVVQLRYGCGTQDCPTPSCFSCRRRLAGKAPIRRYNPTSARTLAVYLASLDNPTSRLCPHLQPPTGPSDAVKPLYFSSKVSSHHPEPHRPRRVKSNSAPTSRPPPPAVGDAPGSSTRASSHPLYTQAASRSTSHGTAGVRSSKHGDRRNSTSELQPEIHAAEKPISKDHRSFAANVFGTVAFKMLEWLTPNSLEAIAEKAEVAAHRESPSGSSSPIAHASSIDETDQDPPPRLRQTPSLLSRSKPNELSEEPPDSRVEQVDRLVRTASSDAGNISSRQRGNPETTPPTDTTHASRPSTQSRASSNTRIRTPSLPKPPSKVTIDSRTQPSLDDIALSPSARSAQSDVASKRLVRSPSRNAAQLSLSNIFDAVSDDQTSDQDTPSDGPHTQLDGVSSDASPIERELISQCTADTASSSADDIPVDDSASELDAYLPQSLSRLNIQAINFISDVLQEDGTTDTHRLQPPRVENHLIRHPSPKTPWKRKRKSPASYPKLLKLEWKLFAEQSLFHVLSSPSAILESFSTSDGLMDSQDLWYCMLRLTRVAPEIVFDSLWQALAHVFTPPTSLQSSSSPMVKSLSSDGASLTNLEAGRLISVCFHVLAASTPIVTDSRLLNDLSRLRSRGLTFPSTMAVSRQSTSLHMHYEDIFTDPLAMRLAKRLLKAIPARRCFDDLLAFDVNTDTSPGKDVVLVLFKHIESPMPSLLDFSRLERSQHEKRMPILILDWARAVMLQEWEGSPEVPRGDSFGGALSLMSELYKNRQSLMLGDVHFRTEYFGERLDTIEMPVSWQAFTPSNTKSHLLDYPFLFSSASLVSYFRAINFSRMSRSYEEASSVQSRIYAVTDRDPLVTDMHQKDALHDLLRVASSRFLVLDVSRHDVLQDALNQLWRREERELMRPLKVHLGEDGGEEGFDSGGVQQEFFRLAIAEALDPDNGAFTVDERTRMTWFQPGSVQPLWKFELVGLLMSLAVYNGLTLPITFPKALYQMLLGEPVTELHHIADGWPDLANGLTNLLEWNEKDGAVEDIFVLTYEFSTSMFGQPVSRQMLPRSEDLLDGETDWPQFSGIESLAADNPTDAPLVTSDNRNAYVSDYIRYLTRQSVEPQFEALRRGFYRCLPGKPLALLNPTLLQQVVEGQQEIDISDLRRSARYVGWDTSHHTVRDFWSVVKRFDSRMRRRLLEFITASDRVPVGGSSAVQLVIQKNGEELGEDSDEEEGEEDEDEDYDDGMEVEDLGVSDGQGVGGDGEGDVEIAVGQLDSDQENNDEVGRRQGQERDRAPASHRRHQPQTRVRKPRRAPHLPTAYTCYSTLLLPEYADREVLRERLSMALENAQGFGFA